jgi:hypothetical protein
MKNLFAVLVSISSLVACSARSSDDEKVRALFATGEKAAEERDSSDILDLVADDYGDSRGLDKRELGNFLRAWLLAHPKVELIVNVESLEFPADGLAQAVLAVASVSLSDPEMERLNVELRRVDGEWLVARVDRDPRR